MRHCVRDRRHRRHPRLGASLRTPYRRLRRRFRYRRRTRLNLCVFPPLWSSSTPRGSRHQVSTNPRCAAENRARLRDQTPSSPSRHSTQIRRERATALFIALRSPSPPPPPPPSPSLPMTHPLVRLRRPPPTLALSNARHRNPSGCRSPVGPIRRSVELLRWPYQPKRTVREALSTPVARHRNRFSTR